MAGELTAKVVGTGGDGASASLRSNSTNSDSRTKITIKGFGLGLNLAGADSLVAHNLEDYNKAVKFAFKSMQNVDVGMIHGVEVVSWMNNLEFQNAVNFRKTEEIEWVLPKNMAGEEIVGAHKIRSVVPGNQIAAAVVGPNGVITSPAVFDMVFVELVEVKAITMINAEFITGLEAYYRKESYTVTKFVACQQEVKSLMALNKGNYYLQDHTQARRRPPPRGAHHAPPPPPRPVHSTPFCCADGADQKVSGERLDRRTGLGHYDQPCSSEHTRAVPEELRQALLRQVRLHNRKVLQRWQHDEVLVGHSRVHAHERRDTFLPRHPHDRLPRGGQGLHVHAR